MQNRIKEVMDKIGYTSTKLSEDSCIDFGDLVCYMNNERQPGIEDGLKMAKLLDTQVYYLFGISNNPIVYHSAEEKKPSGDKLAQIAEILGTYLPMISDNLQNVADELNNIRVKAVN